MRVAIFTINPDKSTLHGSFSRTQKPILTINSGDTVRYSTLDALWGLEQYTQEGVRRIFEPKDSKRDTGHALCGPIAIKEAEPGMVLKIDINEIIPDTWGWSFAGGSQDIKKRLNIDTQGERYHLNWFLDSNEMIATSDSNHKITIRPFMGIMGMPPDEPGLHSTIPPRYCGGNIDCKELVAGSTLFLPVSVPGALFSVGDGHAAQGDGEVCTQAIECPMSLVDLTFTLCKGMRLQMPRAFTPKEWITFGFDESLDEACLIALNAMLDLMEEKYGFHREEAYTLASLVVDLRITQIVNGIKGVHAVLPHGALDSLR